MDMYTRVDYKDTRGTLKISDQEKELDKIGTLDLNAPELLFLDTFNTGICNVLTVDPVFSLLTFVIDVFCCFVEKADVMLDN